MIHGVGRNAARIVEIISDRTRAAAPGTLACAA
jgi:hypothetical protein